MTYNVSGGTLNPTHSLTHSLSAVLDYISYTWYFNMWLNLIILTVLFSSFDL